MPVKQDTQSDQWGHVSQAALHLPIYAVHTVKNVTLSEKDNGVTITVLSCTKRPTAPDLRLPIHVVDNAMKKISGRSWAFLVYSEPQGGQELRCQHCLLNWQCAGLKRCDNCH